MTVGRRRIALCAAARQPGAYQPALTVRVADWRHWMFLSFEAVRAGRFLGVAGSVAAKLGHRGEVLFLAAGVSGG